MGRIGKVIPDKNGRGFVVFFVGMPASGKTTLAFSLEVAFQNAWDRRGRKWNPALLKWLRNYLECGKPLSDKKLFALWDSYYRNRLLVRFDADDNRDPWRHHGEFSRIGAVILGGHGTERGFSKEERVQNAWQLVKLVKGVVDRGGVAICASVLPYKEQRAIYIDQCGGRVLFVHVRIAEEQRRERFEARKTEPRELLDPDPAALEKVAGQYTFDPLDEEPRLVVDGGVFGRPLIEHPIPDIIQKLSDLGWLRVSD